MATLLERSDQALPITELSRSAKRILDEFQSGDHDKYVVMRNNVPAAVMLSVGRYEELLDLIDELRIEIVAAERLGNLKPEEVISHEDMLKKFESTH